MHAIAKNGAEAWVSRRDMLAAGIAAWAVGAVLALSAGWYASHPGKHLHAAESNVETATEPTTDDTAGAAQPLVLPADVVVAPRPNAGITEMQSR